jgi:hypothetical protein
MHTPGDWEIVTPATYTEEGLRRQLCSLCSAPMGTAVIAPHIPGEWTVLQSPSYTEAGIQQQFCADCGDLLEEETIPLLIPVSAIVPGETPLTLHKGDLYTLNYTIEPATASDATVTWYSSDINIASPDPATGEIRAVAPGETVITGVSNDCFATVEIPVTVRYTFGQWCKQYLLFGWAWDK